jgi:hypothetical protein
MNPSMSAQPFRWDEIDQILLAPKIDDLTREMQQAFFDDERQTSFEGQQRGNRAYFIPAFLQKQEERTDEWARRTYKIYCECWQQQHRSITPEFIKSVSDHAITPLLYARKSTVAAHLELMAKRTREPINSTAIGTWHRSIDRLAHSWKKRLEAEARALEYDERAMAKPSSEHQQIFYANATNTTPSATTYIQAPRVFISYSWDDDQHKEWVWEFANRLREQNGLNVILDYWHLRPGMDKNVFMEKSVTESDFVIIICTSIYAARANDRKGGVGYEATIISGQLAENIITTKFIPVLRRGDWQSALPSWIKTKLGVDLQAEPYSEDQYRLLVSTLRNPLVEPLLSTTQTKDSSVHTLWPQQMGEYIATSSQDIPFFPGTLSGYRSEDGRDFWGNPFPSRGTIRIFQGDDWQGLMDFPNTMNGCSAGVFMIRWRLSDSGVLVQSSVRHSSKVGDSIKSGAFGYMWGTNCEQPMFKFAGTINNNESTLVDIYYELKFWQAAP